MKVITIQQPYALLIVLGIKTVETRSWATAYRGELLIHAAKSAPAKNFECLKHLQNVSFKPEDFVTGAIIGKVNLRSVYEAEDWADYADKLGFYNLVEREKKLGDLSPGRFAWDLDTPVEYVKPLPHKGQLGLWNLDPEKYNLLHNQIVNVTK